MDAAFAVKVVFDNQIPAAAEADQGGRNARHLFRAGAFLVLTVPIVSDDPQEVIFFFALVSIALIEISLYPCRNRFNRVSLPAFQDGQRHGVGNAVCLPSGRYGPKCPVDGFLIRISIF
jgi:hypothetical protein